MPSSERQRVAIGRAVPESERAGCVEFLGRTPGLQRVGLLKAIESATAAVFEETVLGTLADEALRVRMRAVVLESNLAGLEEFGPLWFQCIEAKMDRMTLCADWVAVALEELTDSSGFAPFERALVVGAARLLPAYHQYYLDYLATVQDKKVVAALKGSPPPSTRTDLYSSYTAISLQAAGDLVAVPIATWYAEALGPVLAGFDSWIEACAAADGAAEPSDWDAAARGAYLSFLRQYRECLASTADAAGLEAAWTELDHKWMDTKMPIQLLHDIETGYGDPLRCKATPDMSLRFLDESFAKENAIIADIQQRLMKFYTERNTPLARGGLTALSNTMAGIYFIPFKTGISLQFSFSGQSVPNREDVKQAKGVKIYFDAVETAARVEINKKLIAKCYHDAEVAVIRRYKPDAVEQLVWHVAAHEVGHAIYNLEGVVSLFSEPANKSLLEEPRAELTAMFTLRLLLEQGVLDRPKLDESLVHFALDGLRYFDKYDSEALRPYIIFQIYAHKVYHEQGFLTMDATSGKLVIDATKTLAVLEVFAGCFLRILDCMDRADGAGLEAMLFEEMAPENDFVRGVLGLVRA